MAEKKVCHRQQCLTWKTPEKGFQCPERVSQKIRRRIRYLSFIIPGMKST